MIQRHEFQHPTFAEFVKMVYRGNTTVQAATISGTSMADYPTHGEKDRRPCLRARHVDLRQ